MKRGFEENVPKVRPRVRLGRALDEQLAEAEQVAAEEERPAVAITEVPAPPDPEAAAPMLVAAAPEAHRPEPAPARRAPRRAPGPSISEVTDLVHELTTDLGRAAETNGRLKCDLDAALASLRQAADESRDQRAESARLSLEVDKRASELRAMRADLELLEAERDGALSQVARISRELREEKTRGASSAANVESARAEVAQAREALQRLTAELHARVTERDEARRDLLAARSERERLAEELLAAHADAEAAAQSRNALEEIHKALAEARARMSGIR
jgi:hypothetical protein